LGQEGLSGRLEYAGEPDFAGKVRFLRSCSVFCLPSRLPERGGIACIEALAAGVPLIVPDQGMLREIVSLTGGGVLVPPNSPQALSDAIARLRDDPEEADRLGEHGAKGVGEYFSDGAMAEDTLEAYRGVLAS
jgi:rhamnosyl/mannosyltransferase